MKIYNVVISVVSDCEAIRIDATPFRTREKAVAYKTSIADDERNYAKRDGFIIEADDENRFLAYKDGMFCTDHSYIEIVEQEI